MDARKTITAPPLKERSFFGGIFSGLKSLLTGMGITFKYFSHPSTIITQQYPENRDTLKMFGRSRIELTMPLDENGMQKCTGCGICDGACPNGSINVVSRKNPATGKLEIDHFIWRMDSCTFCNMCVIVCPFGAITMGDHFESSVYDRRLLIFNLNRYAGPPASVLTKLENVEDRKKMMEPRGRYSGPVALTGTKLAGVKTSKFAGASAAAAGVAAATCAVPMTANEETK